MLITELRVGQSVFVDEVALKLVKVDGDKVKLAIDAPKEIPIKFEKRPRLKSESRN